MPKGNGTGPLGEGPMTGRGMGFCILKKENEDPNRIVGFIGIEGKPYRETVQKGKKTTLVPGRDTTPTGMGPTTGRAVRYYVGYPVPKYTNPTPGRAVWEHGWPTPYGSAIYPSIPYTPMTAVRYPMYSCTVGGFRRSRGRGWRRGGGFRFWY
jgi:hypothetical protein